MMFTGHYGQETETEDTSVLEQMVFIQITFTPGSVSGVCTETTLYF